MGSPAIHPIGAFIQGPNPIQDIINGMVQGVQLHDQIQRAQDEHAAIERAALQQTRENRIQDITQKMMLGTNSRPVNPDGTVTEQSELPAFSVGGVNMPAQPVSYARKADKSRTVTYTDQDGNAMQREMLTPMEQIQRQVTTYQALARAQGKIMDIDPGSTLGQWMGIDNPTTVPTTALPQLYRPMITEADNKRNNDTRVTTNAATNATREDAIDATNDRADANRTAANDRAAGANKTRLDIAATRPGRGGALTANAGAVQTRFNQQQQADQRTVDTLQQQEQKLHGQPAGARRRDRREGRRYSTGSAQPIEEGHGQSRVPGALENAARSGDSTGARATADTDAADQQMGRRERNRAAGCGARSPGNGPGRDDPGQRPTEIERRRHNHLQ